MSEITRFSIDMDGSIDPDPEGRIVYYDDVRDLESENARLRLALTDAHDVTAEAKAQVKKDVLALMPNCSGTLRAAIEAL